MRHLFTILSFGVMMFFALACGGKRDVTHSALFAQEITLSPEAIAEGISDTLQLGRMRQGEIIAKTLRLKNQSQHPIVILRDMTSCGCTTATYSRKPIAPESSCDITIEFNSQGQMGWQMKLLELYFAETDTPLKIYIDAEVE